jgi:hypothetical protein
LSSFAVGGGPAFAFTSPLQLPVTTTEAQRNHLTQEPV